MNYFDEFPKTKKTASGIPGVRMNEPISPSSVKGDVGIEFEFEASNSLPWSSGEINSVPPDPTTGAYWLAKEDHSLRGGAEYVTSTAVSIEYVPTLVRGLYSSLKDFKTKLRLSNRCSTHVHLNASTWKIDKVVSAFVLWSLFEPILIEWCGPRRKLNHFCLSMQDTPQTIDCLSQFLKQGIWSLPDGTKYTAFNLRRLFDIGTIEIRCGDAWEDPEKAIRWIQFLSAFKDYAYSIENPAMIPGIISGDTPAGILADICEKAGIPDFFRELTGGMLAEMGDREFDRVCYASFRDTIHLCYFPWDDWLPLINREHIPNPFTKPKRPMAGAAGGIREIRPRAVRDDMDVVNLVLGENR